MRLYLVRHGEALPPDLDPDRGLSDHGQDQAARVGKRLCQRGLRISDIRSSKKARARQTAEIIATELPGEIRPSTEAGLSPGDSVEAFAAGLRHQKQDLMVVGHLPFLPALATHLLEGQSASPLSLPTSGVLILRREDEYGWSLEDRMLPEGQS